MGIEKDYIIRQLMMMFEALRKILRLRIEGKKEEALEEIHHFYKTLRIDEDVENKEIKELISFLETDMKLTRDQIELVGFVLKERGELEDDRLKKMNYFSKSFFILEKVDRESIDFSMDRQIKLAELRDLLNELQLI